MATLTWRPTSASGTSWQNTDRVYDGQTSQAATVSINSSNYSSRYLTVNFSTVDLPEYAQISSATLYIIAKQSSSTSSRRITVQVDVNGNSSSRVINQQLTSTSNTTLNGDVSNYINNLTSLKITGQTTGSSYQSQTFSIYEVYVDIEYEIVEPEPEPDVPDSGASETIDIFLPQPLGSNDKLYWDDIANRYFIEHSTGLIQTDITDKIEFNTCDSYMKITTDEKEVGPTSITVELAKKEDVGGDTPEPPNDGDWIVVNTKNGYWDDTFIEDKYVITSDLIDVNDGKDVYIKIQSDITSFSVYIDYFDGSKNHLGYNELDFDIDIIKTNGILAYDSDAYHEFNAPVSYIAPSLAPNSGMGLSPNDVTVLFKYVFDE